MVVTPHLGASTEEAQVAVAEEAARLLVDFLARGQVRFAVNMPTLNRAELEDLGQYLDLARRLGMLHAQMDRGIIKSATLRYRGEVAGKNTRLITAAFAAGWMETALEGQVNLVNAEARLKERGITLTEETSTDAGDFASMIQAEVVTDRKTYVAAGTLFGREFLRLVRLGPYRLDAHLDGNLAGLHPQRPARPDRRHRHRVRQARGEHRPDERRPRDPRRRGDRRRQPRQRARRGGPEGRRVDLPDVLSVSLITLPPHGELPAWLRP